MTYFRKYVRSLVTPNEAGWHKLLLRMKVTVTCLERLTLVFEIATKSHTKPTYTQ